jgi:hypothetical protein
MSDIKQSIETFEKKFQDIKSILETPMDKAEAQQAIHKLNSMSEEFESIAQAVADRFCISFSTGDYGYGRTYYPKGHDYWEESQAEDYGQGADRGYWLSSSDMC